MRIKSYALFLYQIFISSAVLGHHITRKEIIKNTPDAKIYKYDIYFRKIGNIYINKNSFQIYFINRIDKINYIGQSIHSLKGAQYIEVYKNNLTYIGNYEIESGDMPIGIRRHDLIFKLRPDEGNIIHFTKYGPPRKTWIGGFVEQLDQNK